MCKTVTNIALLFSFSLCAQLNVATAAGGGLRATARSTVQQENSSLRDATAFQDTETLKLTDEDNIALFRDEVEHGHLDREAVVVASEYKDDYDAAVEDVFKYWDPAIGGFRIVEDK